MAIGTNTEITMSEPARFTLAVIAGLDAGQVHALITDLPTWVGRSPQTPRGCRHLVVAGCRYRFEFLLEWVPTSETDGDWWLSAPHNCCCLNRSTVPAEQRMRLGNGDRISGGDRVSYRVGQVHCFYEVELKSSLDRPDRAEPGTEADGGA